MMLQIWVLGHEVLRVEFTWRKPAELLATALTEAMAEHELDDTEPDDGGNLSWPPVETQMDGVIADWGHVVSENVDDGGRGTL